MITITWHCVLLILAIVIFFFWAITRDGDGSYGISTRDVAILLWIIISGIAIVIYGGIFWW